MRDPPNSPIALAICEEQRKLKVSLNIICQLIFMAKLYGNTCVCIDGRKI